jgi:Trk-type K+ transport system membrane component
MIPYGSSYFVLIVMGAMILAGNTAYPVFLRLCIWCSLHILNLVSYAHDFVEWKATLEYILKYPRRVYTNLFPQRQTWWLVFMLFVLNGTDWVAFEVLNLGNASLGEIRPGSRVIDGLFQALGKQLTDFLEKLNEVANLLHSRAIWWVLVSNFQSYCLLAQACFGAQRPLLGQNHVLEASSNFESLICHL